MCTHSIHVSFLFSVPKSKTQKAFKSKSAKSVKSVKSEKATLAPKSEKEHPEPKSHTKKSSTATHKSTPKSSDMTRQ